VRSRLAVAGAVVVLAAASPACVFIRTAPDDPVTAEPEPVPPQPVPDPTGPGDAAPAGEVTPTPGTVDVREGE
jgi:sugar/nucleoside kinase (ribokinase family)